MREIDKLYDEFKVIQDKIDQFRKSCSHTKTKEGLCSWRIGNVESWIMCEECDHPITRVFKSVTVEGNDNWVSYNLS